MKTAHMSATRPFVGSSSSSSEGTRRALKSAALETAVDAYATRILEERSPPEASFDSSLGPYVTSVLRTWDPSHDVSESEEFDSLVELIEEHCCMIRNDSILALQTIADAVRTGFVPDNDYGMNFYSSFSDMSGNGMQSLLSSVLAEVDATPTMEDDNLLFLPPGSSPSPLKPDSLIPHDLLGVLDDPATPTNLKVKQAIKQDEFPTLGEASSVAPPGKKGGKGKRASAVNNEEAADLAASLFRPARSNRPRETEEVRTPKFKPVATSAAPVIESSFMLPVNADSNHYFQQQWSATVEMLLAMYHDLSEDAASAAALMANTDVNVARYIVDGAQSAPPVCRHMLNDGCYRSDCQFSHDLEGHTCLFWLRGRCGKGDNCRFLHGFNERLLEGMHHSGEGNFATLLEQPPAASSATLYSNTMSTPNRPISSGLKSEPMPISSSNYSMPSSTAMVPGRDMTRAYTFPGSESAFSADAQPATHSLPNYLGGSVWKHTSPTNTQFTSSAQGNQANGSPPPTSFANIATKGYNQSSSFSASSGGIAMSSTPATVNSVSYPTTITATAPSIMGAASSSKTVKIPQDLWNPHINRDASAFHIADPMERYHQVSQCVARNDVIDLHFQSTKTFAVVLSHLLPEKLASHGQVWVVTGSGHHVGTKTHQRGGGALESAVMSWLTQEGYEYFRGRDRNGHGGALLVKR